MPGCKYMPGCIPCKPDMEDDLRLCNWCAPTDVKFNGSPGHCKHHLNEVLFSH